MHAKVRGMCAIEWPLWLQGAVAWFCFDPVVGNALRAVGHDVGMPLFEVRSDDVHARITVGPLRSVPVRPHKHPSVLIHARNELEV